MSTPTSPLPPSANFHLWEPCNMRCLGCFAQFKDVRQSILPRGHLPREQALAVTRILAHAFEKVTFVGGEPTLCPWWEELVAAAKALGAVTMLVSNGSRLDEACLSRLRGTLDWITLSIDSVEDTTHVRLGRAVNGQAIPSARYVEILDRARELGYRVKINTVVSRLNAHQDFGPLIDRIKPERWKVFQVLPVAGQNDTTVGPLLIDGPSFDAFIDRHAAHDPVAEGNEVMRGSYAMVDPAGRFFDSASGGHQYSAPILEVGLDAAWREVSFDAVAFEARNGRYDWR